MAIRYIGTSISGIASDTKPTPTANEMGVIFVETDTNKFYQWDTDSWNEVSPTTVLVTDNESTSENNLIPFVANAATATGQQSIEMDGDFHYNPGSGTVTATTFVGNVTGATSGAVTATSIALNGNITTAAARVWTLMDNDDEALSFDAAGKTGILVFDSRNGAERVTMSGDLLVSGDLTVSGTETTVSSTTINVADPLVALATTNTTNAVDIGFYGRYRTNGTNLYTGLVWDAGASKYILFHGNQVAPTTTVNTSGTGHTTSTLIANLEGNVTGNVTGNTSGTAATVTGATQTAIISLGTLTALQVDNLNVNLNTISATTGAINITPAAGSAIVLDGTINVDAGVVTGATSITSTAFTGNLTGNASGTAATVTGAAQTAITSVGTLTALAVSGDTTLSGDLTLDGDSDNIVMQKSYIEFQEDPSEPGYLSDHVRIFATDIHGLGIVTEEHTTANKYTSIGADHLEFDVASTISTNAGDIRIEAAGNNVVVKGTGSAASFLDVESVSGQNSRLRFLNGTTAKWNVGNDVGASNNFTIYNQAASANSIQITAANALTLGGATTVSGNLSVTGDTTVGDGKWVGLSNTNNIQFGSSGVVHLNASGQQMPFNIDTDDDSTTSAFKWYKDGVDGGGTAIMGLLESGFLGVGTAAPSHPLHVTGLSQAGSTSIGYFAGDIDNNAYLMIENTDNDSSGAHAVLYAKQGNANAGDAKVVFEAPGVTWSIGADNSDSDILKIAQNASLETTTRMTIDGSGNVGLGVAPKAALHIAASGDGHAFGGKDITLSDAFGSSAQLTVNLADHQGCYVKVFITGNWATGSHSAVAYLGEFFIQNGANSGSTNEPGAIIRQIDNTYNGSISAQIVDPTNDDFVIQFRTSAAEGNETAYLNFQIMGQFDSVG